MAHKHDFWEGLRGWLLPKLGVIAQFLEDVTGDRYYTESDTHKNQFVGRVALPEEAFEKVLHDLGFDRNPLAAWKHLSTDTDNYEEGSFRKVGFGEYPRMQLHVILYDGAGFEEGESEHTYVYAHWEYRWDTNPIKHYRGSNGRYSAEEGVRRMSALLDEADVEFDDVRPSD